MKKIISMFLVFAMILSLGSLSVFANDLGYEILDETEKILKITSEEGWDNVQRYVDYTDWTIQIWSDVTVTRAFTEFTGNIIGMENGDLEAKPTITTNLATGLIQKLSGGSVKNLILEGTFTGGTQTGMLINTISAGSDGVEVTVSGIENHRSYNGERSEIGLIGIINHDATKKLTVTIVDCVNYADIISSSLAIGSILGAYSPKTVTTDSNDTIKILNCTNRGAVSGSNYVGGIVGGIAKLATVPDNIIIENCKNYGSVTGSASYIGGIIGIMATDDTTYNRIKNCANYGAISGNKHVAGIVGRLNLATISDCYNSGTITADRRYSDIVGNLADTTLDVPSAIVCNQNYLFDVYEDDNYGFNLLCFAKITSTYKLLTYGIKLLDEGKNVIHEGVATGGNYDGQFGVRFYGTKLDENATYYLRPYIQYEDGEVIYVDDIVYTPVSN